MEGSGKTSHVGLATPGLGFWGGPFAGPAPEAEVQGSGAAAQAPKESWTSARRASGSMSPPTKIAALLGTNQEAAMALSEATVAPRTLFSLPAGFSRPGKFGEKPLVDGGGIDRIGVCRAAFDLLDHDIFLRLEIRAFEGRGLDEVGPEGERLLELRGGHGDPEIDALGLRPAVPFGDAEGREGGLDACGTRMSGRAPEEHVLVEVEEARGLRLLPESAGLEYDLDARERDGGIAVAIHLEAVRELVAAEPGNGGHVLGGKLDDDESE